MQLTQLVYVSSYVDEYGTQLPEFIENSALGNDAQGVLGMTLFSNGNIIQLLEGGKTVVNKVFRKLPSECKQFGAIEMSRASLSARCIEETSIGFGLHSLRLITRPPSKISLFKLEPNEVNKRIANSPGKSLMEVFAATHH